MREHSVYMEVAIIIAGYPETKDPNGYMQEGLGPMHMTVDSNGMRSSTSNAYLRPVIDRPNLTIHTDTHVSRILFDQHGDKDQHSPKAIGVQCTNGETTHTNHDKHAYTTPNSRPICSPHHHQYNQNLHCLLLKFYIVLYSMVPLLLQLQYHLQNQYGLLLIF